MYVLKVSCCSKNSWRIDTWASTHVKSLLQGHKEAEAKQGQG